MKEITLETKNYPITICKSAGEKIDLFLAQRKYSSIYILMDENVMEKCWPILYQDCESLKNSEILLIEAGESQKTIEIASQLWETLNDYGADRSSLMVNFGGGVISDLGGFIASTFKRGMDFINIPTTLLSMVDASIGGKTAINLQSSKNQVGLFSEPQALFIQPDFLKTLDEKQILSGWAEMLKHGLIADKSHWESLISLETINPEDLENHILRSIEIKKEVVEKDPLEKNIRKTLNFGHTLGHALETWSLKNDEESLLHGEAVAIGMILESYLSVKLSQLKSVEFEEIYTHISRYFKPYHITDAFINHLEKLLSQDKKKSGNELNLTFVTTIGKSIINQQCNLEDIKESIIFYKETI